MPASDIEAGARWSNDIATQLDETRFGVICLTRENLEAPWVIFEAGALSKTLSKTFVCPYLFGIEPTDLKGPLVQFQAIKADKGATKKLVHTINRGLDENALTKNALDKAFDKWWPELEGLLKIIPPAEKDKLPTREDREILEEILGLLRNQTRVLSSVEPKEIVSSTHRYDPGSRMQRIVSLLDDEDLYYTISDLSNTLALNRKHILLSLDNLERDDRIFHVETDKGIFYKSVKWPR
jgi:hypothetical protein